MRPAAILAFLVLLMPSASAQSGPGIGHLTIEVVPKQLAFDTAQEYAFEMWVNMTIQCDAGNDDFLFPQIVAVPAENDSATWYARPDAFVANGPFQQTWSDFGQPTTYGYPMRRVASIEFRDSSYESGTDNITWNTWTRVEGGVYVPPPCTQDGFRWVIDHADTLTVTYPRYDGPRAPGGGSVIDRLEGAQRAADAPAPTESAVFPGHGRLPQDALAILAGAALLALALIGFFVRRP